MVERSHGDAVAWCRHRRKQAPSPRGWETADENITEQQLQALVSFERISRPLRLIPWSFMATH